MSGSLSGRRLGKFEVGARVGLGGMGEVYRARDTRLNRDVAIKILLPEVAADAERLARFSREAQVLASLNHPQIAQIHGIEDGDSGPLLVMEFVEGPTLADRIGAGPIAVEEAIRIARQIADALEAAHERGIIHRDLKPANIKVNDDGAVKVLDFGLAKAMDPIAAGGGSASFSPTITSPAMTQAGIILGTAAYMSPEQAKGRVVDKRSDIWAFGCVLYEMLTGVRAFNGEDVTDTIAAVVRADPDWSKLPADTPPHIRLLVQRCLDKDRRTRISDVGVARFLMNESLPLPGGTVTPAPKRASRVAVFAAAAGLIAGAVIAGAAWSLRAPSPPPVVPVRFTITPPAAQPLLLQGNDHDLAIAPDGSFIVYRSGNIIERNAHLMVRAMNELEPRVLPGTANARFPFISPDGRYVGFTAGPELRKIAIAGGAAETIARTVGAPRGASWGEDGSIIFSALEGLRRVSASGGEPAVLTAFTQAKPEQHVLPHVLPGGKWVLFTAYPGTDYLSARVEALELATGQRKVVLPSGQDATYLPSGYLVYGLTNASADADRRFSASLRAVRFDPVRVEVVGDSVTIVESLNVGASPMLNYTLSPQGHLAFVPAGVGTRPIQERTLVWVDRAGRESAIPAPPRAYAMARLSPDGTRVLVDVRDQGNDVWIWDLRRQLLSPLNRHSAQDLSPIWMPGGKHVIWTSTRGGGNPNLFIQAADGTGSPERLTNSNMNQFPTSVTADGGTVVIFGAGGTTLIDVFTIDLKAADRQPVPLIQTQGLDLGGELSPDGKWLVYQSTESGEAQVYVRPFPNVQQGRWQISTAGGTRAMWTRNGREILYLDDAGLLTSVAVSIRADGSFDAGVPRKLLNSSYVLGVSALGLDLRGYDATPDGERFLMIKNPVADSATPPPLANMVVVLDWGEEIKQRLPARN
jgi:Tol biopolymer transport system component